MAKKYPALGIFTEKPLAFKKIFCDISSPQNKNLKSQNFEQQQVSISGVILSRKI
jgi:hypothetical protein